MANTDKLLWIDLEMTGLDVEKERIIEVAAIVTDIFFNELEQYHSVVFQPQEFLDRMDDWNKRTHAETGLLPKIAAGKKENVVEEELKALVRKHFGKERPVLAGNTISQDRLFIDRYMKDFASLLHYRSMDVTAWKIIMNSRYNLVYTKDVKHKAIDDVRESINELKFYLKVMDKAQGKN